MRSWSGLHHHLLYFWVTAREGGLINAAAKLRLTHSTLSTQIHALEEFLGSELFQRRGRTLVLTPLGVDIARYADEIFHMGAELVAMARGRATTRRSVLSVGVVAALPKTVAYRLLEPVLSAGEYGQIFVRQDSYERLLDDLGMSRVHLVLSDFPPPEIHVQVTDEFDDAAMMRALGVNGRGLFPAHSVLPAEVEDGHGAVPVGPVDGVRERYYAVSTERKARHPVMVPLLGTPGAKVGNSTAPVLRLVDGLPGRPQPLAQFRRTYGL